MYDLRREIFAPSAAAADLRFYDRNPVGRLMTRVTSDVEVLNELFSSGVVTVFGDVFTLVSSSSSCSLIDWRLALVTLAVHAARLPRRVRVPRAIRDAYRDIRIRLARINAFLQERITGHERGAAVRARGRTRRALPRDRPRLPRGAPALDHVLRAVLPGHRGADRGRRSR